jgi:DNA-binding PadR family transcriptional regulator
MSLKHSMLAVLSLGDCHGYQLRQEIESRTGEVWQINVGQIYSTLDRLERDGLVNGGDSNHDGQIRYSITAAGKVEADQWLNSPVERAAQSRDELAMKLALAVTLPGVDAERIVNLQRLSALRNLQTLTTAKKNTDVGNAKDLAWVLVVDSQIFATEAELRWLDHVEGLLGKAAARGLETQQTIETNPARRGRPAKSASETN